MAAITHNITIDKGNRICKWLVVNIGVYPILQAYHTRDFKVVPTLTSNITTTQGVAVSLQEEIGTSTIEVIDLSVEKYS